MTSTTAYAAGPLAYEAARHQSLLFAEKTSHTAYEPQRAVRSECHEPIANLEVDIMNLPGDVLRSPITPQMLDEIAPAREPALSERNGVLVLGPVYCDLVFADLDTLRRLGEERFARRVLLAAGGSAVTAIAGQATSSSAGRQRPRSWTTPTLPSSWSSRRLRRARGHRL